jgi:hypothetical protein
VLPMVEASVLLNFRIVIGVRGSPLAAQEAIDLTTFLVIFRKEHYTSELPQRILANLPR